ncbi:glycerate kinase type-2 family protein [Roseibium alexandrii]|uniref:Putative glycerate kinase n=1 Tax=Roseibium alexandrii (strain DSM 17067 / NCIMB 14079 / DFL-11) TaxID=244592 RepID=A0A5E8H961_ROSAD|nr:glycerate kinase [Roseibium alexandrii]EEE47956.2 putative glycerate kinase [Roseibium alexandrii DFL-11]
MAANPQELLRALFERAVEVADPMKSLASELPDKPDGRVVVIGAGKASARMAEAVEAEWGACEGLVITRYGYGRPTRGIEIVEAAHPVPDKAGQDATKRMLELLSDLDGDDFVLALISGGASALLTAPAGAISLEEKQAVNQALLASGAPIGQMNVVRKHLSRVKGGQLAAAAYPAKMVAMLLSDVPGDDPAEIGSGPTVGDGSTPEDARQILARWNIEVPVSVSEVLSGKTGVLPPDHESLGRVTNTIFAAPSQSLEAASSLAEKAGCDVEILGDALEGEARDVAATHADLALQRQKERGASERPLILLSGGELTVTRRGDGIGGPNAEYALALANSLTGAAGVHAIACDTDGVDGAAEVAGAIIGPDTPSEAAATGVSMSDALERNDAHEFFRAIGNQVVTGPTLTNVNDFRAIYIDGV